MLMVFMAFILLWVEASLGGRFVFFSFLFIYVKLIFNIFVNESKE